MNTLYSNYFLDEDFQAEKECLEEDLEEGETISDEAVWSALYDNDIIYYEDFEYQMKKILSDYNIIVKADVGTWRGRFEAYKLIRNINDFRDLIDGNTYDYVIITEDKKHIKLELIHHDATTYCEMKLVNKQGDRYIENKFYNLGFEELKNVYNNYSKLIRQLCY